MKYNAFESRCIILYFISPSVEVLSSIHAFSKFFSVSNLQRRPVAFCLSGGLQRSCSASGQPRSRNGLYVHSFSRFDTSLFISIFRTTPTLRPYERTNERTQTIRFEQENVLVFSFTKHRIPTFLFFLLKMFLCCRTKIGTLTSAIPLLQS